MTALLAAQGLLAQAAPSALAGGAGQVVFYLLAVVAVVSAVVVVTHRTPVVSALFLVINLLTVAALYVLLGAYTMAAIQVVVYAGAIVVLITFVIMLLNLAPETRGGPGWGTIGLAFVLGAALVYLLAKTGLRYESLTAAAPAAAAQPYGTVAQLGAALFGPYFYPFEVISLVLVAAMTGAVLLAKRNLED